MNKPITIDEIASLPVADRLRLIELLWDSLEADADRIPMPDWQKEEIIGARS